MLDGSIQGICGDIARESLLRHLGDVVALVYDDNAVLAVYVIILCVEPCLLATLRSNR